MRLVFVFMVLSLPGPGDSARGAVQVELDLCDELHQVLGQVEASASPDHFAKGAAAGGINALSGRQERAQAGAQCLQLRALCVFA
jgi:hypothetical protein